MNKLKITHLASTAIFCLMMIGSATMYFISPEVAETFTKFGYPAYFRIELGVFKYLGVIVLAIPAFPLNVKEWAYAGFGITLISAPITHYFSNDPIATIFPSMFAFALLTISYVSFKKKLAVA
jgi:hypothetical protein